jgi:DNA-binding HxlR family transcriptional regulator
MTLGLVQASLPAPLYLENAMEASPIDAITKRTESLREAGVQLFAQKWSVAIIVHLDGGMLRFNELKSRIAGISAKSLTTALKMMEADRLVTRKYVPVIPPRVEYQLTQLGQDFAGALIPLSIVAARLHSKEELRQQSMWTQAGLDCRTSSPLRAPGQNIRPYEASAAVEASQSG